MPSRHTPSSASEAEQKRSNGAVLPWAGDYALRLVITDLFVLLASAVAAKILAFGAVRTRIPVDPAWEWMSLNYIDFSLLLSAAWMAALAAVGSRSERVIGEGSTEFKLVLHSAVIVVALLAVIAFFFKFDFSRSYVVFTLVQGVVGLILGRLLWRRWLREQRRLGRYSSCALVVGSAESVRVLAKQLLANPHSGYGIAGALVPHGNESELIPGTDIPIVGRPTELADALESIEADTVVVVSGHELSPDEMRNLSWSLEAGMQRLVLTPNLTDIAGPRIHARPVAGLPLIHVETPRYEGTDRVVKRGFDILFSVLLLVVLFIPLGIVAIIVAITSPGGVFYAHERVGRCGEPFKMLKFRSMTADADARLAGLLKDQGTSDKPLFKVQNDPRITRIGKFLRRYSIDEIPQLVNVLRGEMSLVGPRPQVAGEVALYDNAARRRLIVKPGMTGLWQVSGRSNLSWEESVRLDLYYVENWSLTSDLAILARTVRAVIRSEGAI